MIDALEYLGRFNAVAVPYNPEFPGFLWTLRQDGQGWVLPGGGANEWELPQDAALRELEEETGLDGVVKAFLGIYRLTTPWAVFLVEVVGPTDVRADPQEVAAFAWGWTPPSDGAPQNPMTYGHRAIAHRARVYLGSMVPAGGSR